SRIHRRTLWPFSASRLAMAVPKLPPPSTAMGCCSVMRCPFRAIYRRCQHYTLQQAHSQNKDWQSLKHQVTDPTSPNSPLLRLMPTIPPWSIREPSVRRSLSERRSVKVAPRFRHEIARAQAEAHDIAV